MALSQCLLSRSTLQMQGAQTTCRDRCWHVPASNGLSYGMQPSSVELKSIVLLSAWEADYTNGYNRAVVVPLIYTTMAKIIIILENIFFPSTYLAKRLCKPNEFNPTSAQMLSTKDHTFSIKFMTLSNQGNEVPQ